MQAAVSHDTLIFASAAALAGTDPRALRRAAQRGELVRVRRGAYCDRARWEAAGARDRHLMLIHAVVADARNPIIIAGSSAAVVWGMPTASPPTHAVVVLDRYRGGGRTEPGVVRTTAGAATADVVVVDGIPVTTLARTALDVARASSFPDAVAAIDWARWRGNPRALSLSTLERELERLSPRGRAAHLHRAVAFSTHLADSYAESVARAMIHELGFAAPILQLPIQDEQGAMFADFAWPEAHVIVEFNGRVKYEDRKYNGGDPVEKLLGERRREARLRGLGWTVVHIEWADLMSRERLAGLLRDGRVPRVPGFGGKSDRPAGGVSPAARS